MTIATYYIHIETPRPKSHRTPRQTIAQGIERISRLATSRESAHNLYRSTAAKLFPVRSM